MLILSALLRAVHAVARLGVRVAGSVEIGRSYRNPIRSEQNPRDKWLDYHCKFDEVDWYQTIPEHQSPGRTGYDVPPQGRCRRVAKSESQPIDVATGLPTGKPIARPQESE